LGAYSLWHLPHRLGDVGVEEDAVLVRQPGALGDGLQRADLVVRLHLASR
jgi:hypothetical protein